MLRFFTLAYNARKLVAVGRLKQRFSLPRVKLVKSVELPKPSSAQVQLICC